jgi:cyclopropane fatty-acyl-phospholipid synthase-like methyltransferase
MNSPIWQYNEMSQVGIDYADASQVIAYDSVESKLRDIRKEIEDVMDNLVLTQNQTVLDFGTGTG